MEDRLAFLESLDEDIFEKPEPEPEPELEPEPVKPKRAPEPSAVSV